MLARQHAKAVQRAEEAESALSKISHGATAPRLAYESIRAANGALFAAQDNLRCQQTKQRALDDEGVLLMESPLVDSVFGWWGEI